MNAQVFQLPPEAANIGCGFANPSSTQFPALGDLGLCKMLPRAAPVNESSSWGSGALMWNFHLGQRAGSLGWGSRGAGCQGHRVITPHLFSRKQAEGKPRPPPSRGQEACRVTKQSV